MAIKHEITHYYQPTNNSCSQTALAILLSYFGKSLTPEDILEQIPVNVGQDGEELGLTLQQLATWCISQGFDAEMHTADFQIIDLSWIGIGKEGLLSRMKAAKNSRYVHALGEVWSRAYMQSYIDFVEAGGALAILPYMTTGLLNDLLTTGPIVASVAYSVLYGEGRSRNIALRRSKPDDIDGGLTNHSVVVYGIDQNGDYLVADPWREPGLHIVKPEQLIAAMTAAQVECDNLLFQLKTSA